MADEKHDLFDVTRTQAFVVFKQAAEKEGLELAEIGSTKLVLTAPEGQVFKSNGTNKLEVDFLVDGVPVHKAAIQNLSTEMNKGLKAEAVAPAPIER